MKPIPIFFYGDSPDLRGGLSRIGRDLAVLTSTLPEFRVGYFGRGGHGSRQLPFAQYNFSEYDQWGEMLLQKTWEDFSSGINGVILSIWDASRLTWFGAPRPEGIPKGMYEFLTSGTFQRWGYFPVDATSPTGGLSFLGAQTLKGYNRVLAYTKFGADVLQSNWIPHGINMDKFQPRGKTAGRLALGINQKDRLVGCVMTNQQRKDWGLAFAAINEVRKSTKAKFWVHVDVLERSHAWSIPALITDFNAGDWVKVTFSGAYNDEELSHFYSACDLTILPSLGEGFGYPVVESLACGVPVVTGNYAGSAELIVNKQCLVEPAAWRLESLGNCIRPVYDPAIFAEVVLEVLSQKADSTFCRTSVEHLDWKRLWPGCWKKWLLGGLR